MKIEYPTHLVNGKLMHNLSATVIPAKISTVVAAAQHLLADARERAELRFNSKNQTEDEYIESRFKKIEYANEQIRKKNASNFLIRWGIISPEKEIEYNVEHETECARFAYKEHRDMYILYYERYYLDEYEKARLINFSKLKFKDPDEIMYVTLEDYNLLGLESIG